MKKIIIGATAITMCVALAACGNNQVDTSSLSGLSKQLDETSNTISSVQSIDPSEIAIKPQFLEQYATLPTAQQLENGTAEKVYTNTTQEEKLNNNQTDAAQPEKSNQLQSGTTEDKNLNQIQTEANSTQTENLNQKESENAENETTNQGKLQPDAKNSNTENYVTKNSYLAGIALTDETLYREDVLQKTAHLKNTLAKNLKISKAQVTAIKELTKTLSKYTNSVAYSQKELDDNIIQVKNLKKKPEKNAQKIDAKLSKIVCVSNARAAYYENILNVLNEIENYICPNCNSENDKNTNTTLPETDNPTQENNTTIPQSNRPTQENDNTKSENGNLTQENDSQIPKNNEILPETNKETLQEMKEETSPVKDETLPEIKTKDLEESKTNDLDDEKADLEERKNLDEDIPHSNLPINIDTYRPETIVRENLNEQTPKNSISDDDHNALNNNISDDYENILNDNISDKNKSPLNDSISDKNKNNLNNHTNSQRLRTFYGPYKNATYRNQLNYYGWNNGLNYNGIGWNGAALNNGIGWNGMTYGGANTANMNAAGWHGAAFNGINNGVAFNGINNGVAPIGVNNGAGLNGIYNGLAPIGINNGAALINNTAGLNGTYAYGMINNGYGFGNYGNGLYTRQFNRFNPSRNTDTFAPLLRNTDTYRLPTYASTSAFENSKPSRTQLYLNLEKPQKDELSKRVHTH